MTATIDFNAYALPANRVLTLWDIVPEMHRAGDDSGDLRRLLDEVLQPIVDELFVSVDHWPDIINPDIAPEGVLDRMLSDLGNPFPFVLDVAQKRALVQTLADIYRRSGTASGLEACIRFFARVEGSVVPHLSSSWELGVDELGVGTILGGSGASVYSFDVEVSSVLTEAQRTIIGWLASTMKASHEHFVSLIEP